ncbi:MAG TPA: hypothetical protein PK208_11325 [Fibrobacteria bacterium]|nr:hypothetical protein [Fibrobacteria bacterium]
MRILLSSGEVSGDAIGGRLAREFRGILPSVDLAGCVGASMESAGVRALAGIGSFSHAGWVSVLSRLPWVAWSAWSYFRRVDRFAPDLVVAVDAPGLHGPLLGRCSRKGIRCAWVAPPQLWAWKNRSVPLLRGMDVYPAHRFEIPSLERAGANAFWWGFPGERPCSAPPVDRPLLALFPGSRSAWRDRHARWFVSLARQTGLPLEPVLVHPAPRDGGMELGVRCLTPGEALPAAALALCLPGTSTLQTAMWGVPTVVAARPGRIDLMIAGTRLASGSKVLPNRILGDGIFPEFYAEQATSERVVAALRESHRDRREIASRLVGLPQALGEAAAPRRIAEHVLGRNAA